MIICLHDHRIKTSEKVQVTESLASHCDHEEGFMLEQGIKIFTKQLALFYVQH